MGTPSPPAPPGGISIACWGPGGSFGLGPPPLFIKATFTGYEPGEEFVASEDLLLLTPHWLEQQENPLKWEVSDGTFLWTVEFNIDGTFAAIIRPSDSRTAFFQAINEICLLELNNALDDERNTITFNGTLTLEV